jgi:hypothetical protein
MDEGEERRFGAKKLEIVLMWKPVLMVVLN